MPSAQDLYEEQLVAYHDAVEQGSDYARRRFGFVLFHSLPGEEAVALKQQMGFQPALPTDFYNLGVVAAQKEQYAEAVAQFQKALEGDPELAEAEFNLSLALEKSGDLGAARKQWASYLKRENLSEADHAAVAEHVKELG